MPRSVRALLLCAALGGVGDCTSDSAHSPTCGLALLAGPALVRQQLENTPYVVTEAPRGLPGSLPARVAVYPQQGEVLVTYRPGQLAMRYQGPFFPTGSISDTTTYALLIVDDSTERAQGVLIYESRRPPPHYPALGTLSGADRSIPLYGVRVDWRSVSNPRCPLLGVARPSAR
jgi:hypothetical protein